MCVFADVMGVAARGAARQAKARNPIWMGRLGLAIGVVGRYAHWAAWLAIADTRSFGSARRAPGHVALRADAGGELNARLDDNFANMEME